MINSRKPLEKLLQNYRFRMVKKYLYGDVLDFGGNEGELKRFVKGEYTSVNYDHSAMSGKRFHTIVLLAVLEHIEVREVFQIFRKFNACLNKGGIIFLTTPSPAAKFVLEILASLRILDKENIEEHKHYWTKNELFNLARETDMEVIIYRRFQLGFNQYMVLKHNNSANII